jgi:hypothetical protein
MSLRKMKQIEYQMNSYDFVTNKYAVWLDTLGYSSGLVSGCKYRVTLFLASKRQVDDSIGSKNVKNTLQSAK